MTSKKHYKQVAEVIKQGSRAQKQGDTTEIILARREALQNAAKAIADVFQQDNPNFDRVKFLAACGFVEESK